MGQMKARLMEMMETPIMDTCPTCDGTGEVEFEIPRPHNFGRDVGVIDVGHEHCETCDGGGKLYRLCTQCEAEITEIMGPAGFVCVECFEDMFPKEEV